MTLTARSRALVQKIEHTSRLPLLLRASMAERLVLEAAALLVELSDRAERIDVEVKTLLVEVKNLNASKVDKIRVGKNA